MTASSRDLLHLLQSVKHEPCSLLWAASLLIKQISPPGQVVVPIVSSSDIRL